MEHDTDAQLTNTVNPISNVDNKVRAANLVQELLVMQAADSPDVAMESSADTTDSEMRPSTASLPLEKVVEDTPESNSSPDIYIRDTSSTPGTYGLEYTRSTIEPTRSTSMSTASEKGGIDAITTSLSQLPEQASVVSHMADMAVELMTWRDVGKSARALGTVTLLLLLSIHYNLIGMACLVHIGIVVYHAIQQQRRRLEMAAVKIRESKCATNTSNGVIRGAEEDTCPNCLMPRLRQCVADVAACGYWPRARDFVINGLNLSRPLNTAALVAASLVCISVGRSINITICLVMAYLAALFLPLGYKMYVATMAMKSKKTGNNNDKANRCKVE